MIAMEHERKSSHRPRCALCLLTADEDAEDSVVDIFVWSSNFSSAEMQIPDWHQLVTLVAAATS